MTKRKKAKATKAKGRTNAATNHEDVAQSEHSSQAAPVVTEEAHGLADGAEVERAGVETVETVETAPEHLDRAASESAAEGVSEPFEDPELLALDLPTEDEASTAAPANAAEDEVARDDDGASEPAKASDLEIVLQDDDSAQDLAAAPETPSDATQATNAEKVESAHLRGLIEALVFASDSPISARDVARHASAPVKRVREVLAELRQEYQSRGIRLDEVAGGWAFRTSVQYAPFVRDLTKQKPVKLTRAQVESLAIIAYRQPITRPEIDEVRGVDSGPVLKVLLERDLVRILGKRDEPGRPLIYGTTGTFLEFFGLRSLKDLPTLREFTELTDESRQTYEDELGEPVTEGAAAEAEDAGEPSADEATPGEAHDEDADAAPPSSADLGDDEVEADAPRDEEEPLAEHAAEDELGEQIEELIEPFDAGEDDPTAIVFDEAELEALGKEAEGDLGFDEGPRVPPESPSTRVLDEDPN